MLVAVKFVRGYKSYIPNDIAGFEDDVAKQLVKKKYAELLDQPEVVENSDTPKGDFQFNKDVPKLGELVCPVCGKDYKRASALKTHLWKKHGIKK